VRCFRENADHLGTDVDGHGVADEQDERRHAAVARDVDAT